MKNRQKFCAYCCDYIDQEGGPAICPECLRGPCRHGNKQTECDRCDFEADIAYDTARERR